MAVLPPTGLGSPDGGVPHRVALKLQVVVLRVGLLTSWPSSLGSRASIELEFSGVQGGDDMMATGPCVGLGGHDAMVLLAVTCALECCKGS